MAKIIECQDIGNTRATCVGIHDSMPVRRDRASKYFELAAGEPVPKLRERVHFNGETCWPNIATRIAFSRRP